MALFECSKRFPKTEMYSLTDQVRRSSRSVSANLAEAFRKRKYPKAFIAKLMDAEAEAAETQVWVEYAYHCSYIDQDQFNEWFKDYDQIIGKLVIMASRPQNWSY
jgi:four helix bundle protein